MKRGESIIISGIQKGVLVEPYNKATNGKKFITFTNADKFLEWIRMHFQIYEVSKWERENN